MADVLVAIRINPKTQRDEQQTEAFEHDLTTIRTVKSGMNFECTFSRIFSTCSSQEEVYNFVAPHIDRLEEGISSSIFAYGQTGSGKTFTMLGNDEHIGIVLRSVSHVLRNVGDDFKVTFSMMNLYLENIFDLLKDFKSRKALNIREDAVFGIYIPEISEYVVEKASDVEELIKKGLTNHAISRTVMSECRRMNHFIIQLSLERVSPNMDGKITKSKVNFFILAGSELTKRTSATGNQLMEPGYISKSAQCFRRIIELLACKGSKYIPYRDSKLTRLMQDSFQGQARISFIASILPSIFSIEESVRTLRLASQFKEITICPKPRAISVTDSILIKKLQKEVYYLKDSLKMHKNSEIQQLFCTQPYETKSSQEDNDEKSKIMKN